MQKVDALQEALVNLLVVPKTEKEAARLTTVCADLQRVITEACTEAVNTANAAQDGQKGPEAAKLVKFCYIYKCSYILYMCNGSLQE